MSVWQVIGATFTTWTGWAWLGLSTILIALVGVLQQRSGVGNPLLSLSRLCLQLLLGVAATISFWILSGVFPLAIFIVIVGVQLAVYLLVVFIAWLGGYLGEEGDARAVILVGQHEQVKVRVFATNVGIGIVYFLLVMAASLWLAFSALKLHFETDAFDRLQLATLAFYLLIAGPAVTLLTQRGLGMFALVDPDVDAVTRGWRFLLEIREGAWAMSSIAGAGVFYLDIYAPRAFDLFGIVAEAPDPPFVSTAIFVIYLAVLVLPYAVGSLLHARRAARFRREFSDLAERAADLAVWRAGSYRTAEYERLRTLVIDRIDTSVAEDQMRRHLLVYQLEGARQGAAGGVEGETAIALNKAALDDFEITQEEIDLRHSILNTTEEAAAAKGKNFLASWRNERRVRENLDVHFNWSLACKQITRLLTLYVPLSLKDPDLEYIARDEKAKLRNEALIGQSPGRPALVTTALGGVLTFLLNHFGESVLAAVRALVHTLRALLP